MNEYFGAAVAIGGNTAVVGAKGTFDSVLSGSAYVFVRDGLGLWSQQEHLVPATNPLGAALGSRVAISPDGNTVAVSALYFDGTQSNQGAVYIFTRSGTVWSEQAQLGLHVVRAGQAGPQHA